MPIRIIITDDHPLIVGGLHSILKSSPQIEVIATYNSGDDLLEGLKKGLPDVLLTDLQMPGSYSGIDLIRILRQSYPQLPILVLTAQEAIFNVKDIMAHGCNGYLLKNTTDLNMLVQAIEQVHDGELFLEPSLQKKMLKAVFHSHSEKEKPAQIITQRQVEIIRLIAEGNSSPQIAEKLFVSVRTIETHRQRIMQKLDVSNVVSLLKKASELGILS